MRLPGKNRVVERQSQHVVEREEAALLRPLAQRGGVAVVNPVVAPVVEETGGSRCLLVFVFHGKRGHAAGDALVAFEQRSAHRARVGGVEVGHVYVAAQVPVAGYLIAQFGIAAVLFEAHVFAVAVGAVVRAADETRKLALPDAVGHLALQGVERAVSQVDVGLHPLLVHAAGDDVDDTAHGIRAIEHRGRSAQYLHPLGHERLVGIGDGVSEDAGILRVAVDEHHQPARAAAQSAQRDVPGSAARYAVTHDTPRGHEESGYLLGDYRQHRGLHALLDFFAVDDRDGEGQMPHVGFVAGTGHHHLVDMDWVGGIPGQSQERVVVGVVDLGRSHSGHR